MGGYKIIKFKGLDLITPRTIEGIYNSIKETNKALLLSNIVISGKEYDDLFLPVLVSGSDFTFSLDGYNVTITNADLVTAVAAPAA